jgi:hypothetical protein
VDVTGGAGSKFINAYKILVGKSEAQTWLRNYLGMDGRIPLKRINDVEL